MYIMYYIPEKLFKFNVCYSFLCTSISLLIIVISVQKEKKVQTM